MLRNFNNYALPKLIRKMHTEPLHINVECFIMLMLNPLSAAWRSGLERRFYDDHNHKINGSTPNQVSLLRSWIRCFTMTISAWWNLASSKLKKSDKNSTTKLETKAIP